MKILPAIFFLFTFIACSGQDQDSLDYSKNLVQNYSFEEHGELPCERIAIGDYTLFTIDSWAWATYASADIFSTEVPSGCWTHPSTNWNFEGFATQLPRSGEVMLGFYSAGTWHGTEYHEYLVSRLIKPLIPGYKYYVEFWVCRSACTMQASNNIGACFVTSPVFYKNYKPIHAKAQVNHTDVIRETTKWTKISGTFIPEDTLRYMVIGNFQPDTKTKIEWIDKKDHYASPGEDPYYLLDDVYVIPLEALPETPQLELSEFEKADVNEAVILENIFFEHDKYTMLPESYPELEKLLKFMKENPSVVIEVSGHTDNVGPDSYNITLSGNRAKAVADYLTNRGIMDTRIVSKGYGSKMPVADNDTEEGRQQNRRVEFRIIKK